MRSRREGKVAAYSADSPAPSSSAPLGPVLRAVGIACAGAFAFGYHLGVINGPLEAIGKDLAFAGNKALEGLVGTRAGLTSGNRHMCSIAGCALPYSCASSVHACTHACRHPVAVRLHKYE